MPLSDKANIKKSGNADSNRQSLLANHALYCKRELKQNINVKMGTLYNLMNK
jgi:hypothetical protein